MSHWSSHSYFELEIDSSLMIVLTQRKDINWDITKSVGNLITIHSSMTIETITDKKYQNMDLFRRTTHSFKFLYHIYKKEDEQAVMTFTLNLG